MKPLTYYLASVVIAWAIHIVWDATESRTGRLQSQVYYVAFAIIWPLVIGAVLLVPPVRAVLSWWRKRHAPARRA